MGEEVVSGQLSVVRGLLLLVVGCFQLSVPFVVKNDQK
jgi:hypothetical protein